jgi:hypothetical protein
MRVFSYTFVEIIKHHHTTMKNLKLKLTACMMALALILLLIVNAPNPSVLTIGIIFGILQMFLWGRLMSEIKE